MTIDPLRAFAHTVIDQGDDETMRREARAHLVKSPTLQVVGELAHKLRTSRAPFWSAEFCRQTWPAAIRMRYLKQRPDLRQEITTKLTGLAPNAARRFWPDEQASLIDAVIDNRDIAVEEFENAFDPFDLAVYGTPAETWQFFRERMPWDDDSEENKQLVAWCLRAFVADRSSFGGIVRRPILSALDVRSSIDSSIWLQFMPFEILVEVDRARVKHERSRPREPFQARHELAVITPERMASYLPVRELAPVFDRAERAMGFASSSAQELTSEPPDSEAPESEMPVSLEPRPSQIN